MYNATLWLSLERLNFGIRHLDALRAACDHGENRQKLPAAPPAAPAQLAGHKKNIFSEIDQAV